jgi:hypothetical protein
MITVICPKCKKASIVTEGTEYILCCDEVIHIPSNTVETEPIDFDRIQEGLMRIKNDRLFLGDPNESIAPDLYEGL